MKNILQKVVLVLLLFAGQRLMAQVKFLASFSPAQISKDEFAQLKLSVENAKDVQQISPPLLTDFIVVSGPNQESGMSTVNGDIKKYIALNYILKPKRPGNFTIPSTTAIADGVVYRSNPVVLKVSNTLSGNNSGGTRLISPYNSFDPFAAAVPETLYNDNILRKGEDPRDKIMKNIFVKVETDKTSCFVGEPVIATYKLYTRLNSESSMSKNPSFNGFSVIDLGLQDQLNYKREKLNGREYNVYIIRKVQLYPLQPGNLQLETAAIDNTVHFIRSEYANKKRDLLEDMFRDFAEASIPQEGIEDHSLTLQSKPLSILVRPLPDINKPPDFKGAVGDFKLEAFLEKNSFTTDDAGKLTLIISGEGNLQLVTGPEITLPAGIDGFEPRITDDLYKTTVPVSGRKIIDIPFTVAAPGSYNLPSIAFSFFDLRAGKYKTLQTNPLNFSVTKETGNAKNTPIKGNKKKESILNTFFSNRLRVISLLAILIICGLLLWLKKDYKKEKNKTTVLPLEKENLVQNSAPKLENPIVLSNPLAAAEGSLHQNEGIAFFEVLNQAFKNYLSQKLCIPVAELNKKIISEHLDKKGISNETILQLHGLMDEIEWQLYTPFAESSKKQDMYEKANELVHLLNTYKI